MTRRVAALLATTIALGSCGGDDETKRRGRAGDEVGERVHENRRTLPRGVHSEAPVPRRYLSEFVEYYRRLGFFHDRRSNEEVTAALARWYAREFGGKPRIATRLDELQLLANDHRRVWFQDVEADVIPGNDAYVDAFRGWSRISGGAFEPSHVKERWRGEKEVEVVFQLRGQRRSVRGAGLGDFLDLCVLLDGVNPLIRRTGRQFALYRPDGAQAEMAFVVMLSRRERRALERRGWSFARPEEARLPARYGGLDEREAPPGCT